MLSKQRLFFCNLLALSVVSVLPISIFLPSLAQLATDFSVPHSEVTYALSVYLVVSAFFQLALGSISDKFGRRRMVLACLAIFIIASVGCAISQTIYSFIIFRSLQAIVTPVYVLALALVNDSYPRDQVAKKVSLLSAVWAMAISIGPALGGVVAEAFGWRMVFWLLSGLGFASFVGFMWSDNGERMRTQSVSQRSALTGIKLLSSKVFLTFVGCMTFSVATSYIFLTVFPMMSVASYKFSPTLVGLFLGIITVGFTVGSMAAARYGGELVNMVILGRVVSTSGVALFFISYLLGFPHWMAMLGGSALIGIGNGMSVPYLNAILMQIGADAPGAAAGISNSFALIGSAGIASVAGGMVSWGNPEHFSFLIILVAPTISLFLATYGAGMFRNKT